jgi:hypothetical protein
MEEKNNRLKMFMESFVVHHDHQFAGPVNCENGLKIGKQTKGLLTDEWKKKLWYYIYKYDGILSSL